MAISIAALFWLSGCGDPLAGVDRLSDIELADEAQVPAMAAPEEGSDQPVAREGLLQQMIGGDDTTPDAPNAQAGQTAALSAPKPRRGLFGRITGGASNRSSEQPPSVPAGTLLSFGLVKPVCDLPNDKRGAEIEAFPARSKAYRLYDSAPGKTTPHPFYITGFADGCARTFTAAVAVFGAPAMHELLRYGLPAEVQPYSAIDSAYETIKSRVCRVRAGQPCGSKVSAIEKNTVFVSAYETYGSNAHWLEMLLHDGALVETVVKSNPE
ncbi:hypothetical protein ACW9UM_11645 [Marinovum sp. KMM 9989]